MKKELGWQIDDWFTLKVDDRGPDFGAHFYRPGPVVGVVPPSTSTLEQVRKVPVGTRFFGKVYVVPGKTHSGGSLGEIIAVYDRAKLPNREEVPVCFVVGGDGFALPIEELKGDTAKSSSVSKGYVVESWP